MTRTRDCSSCCPGAEILPAICTRSPAETPESEGTLKYMPTPWSWTNRTRHSGSLYVATAVVWTLVPRTDWLAFTSQKEVRTAPACVYNPQERTTEPATQQGVVEPSNACQIIPQRHAVSLCTKVTSFYPSGRQEDSSKMSGLYSFMTLSRGFLKASPSRDERGPKKSCSRKLRPARAETHLGSSVQKSVRQFRRGNRKPSRPPSTNRGHCRLHP